MVPWRNIELELFSGLKAYLGFYSKDNVCYFQENCSEWQMRY